MSVRPNACSEWIGVFAAEYPSPPSISAVCSCPNRRSLCVISGGRGYLVNVNKPESSEDILCFPITGFRGILAAEMLIFSSFTSLAAYGPTGLLWRVPALCTDKLSILEADMKTITCSGLDAPNMQASVFQVETVTGTPIEPRRARLSEKLKEFLNRKTRQD